MQPSGAGRLAHHPEMGEVLVNEPPFRMVGFRIRRCWGSIPSRWQRRCSASMKPNAGV